jgi:hypothetical protein
MISIYYEEATINTFLTNKLNEYYSKEYK